MEKSQNGRFAVFVAAGVVSGVICWSGLFFIPEGSIWLRIYPGVVFGLVLFAVGQFYQLNRRRSRAYPLIVIVAASIAGWWAAPGIGFVYGRPVPMLTAGAFGALIVALGLIGAWGVRKRIGSFLLLITITGALGGQIAQLLWDYSPQLDDDLWTLILFIEWQSLVMIAVAVATRWSTHLSSRN
ncbi:MAG: hypothetical protein U5P41_06580 [Gammaproteobacteria bacterium]|nr:hypothetical protein [Gammaproteobacteria bacterium]